MLVYELDDAHQHLRELIDQMSASGTIDDADFRIQLGHVYAHLNRAWNSRANVLLHELPAGLRAERSKFPTDIDLVG